MTFSERWERIVTALRAKGHLLKLNGNGFDSITQGNFLNSETVAVPPAILVYLDPGDKLTGTGTPDDCTCTILCLRPVTDTIPKATGEAVDQARAAWDIIAASGIPLKRNETPIQIAAVTGEVVITSVQFVTTFT